MFLRHGSRSAPAVAAAVAGLVVVVRRTIRRCAPDRWSLPESKTFAPAVPRRNKWRKAAAVVAPVAAVVVVVVVAEIVSWAVARP